MHSTNQAFERYCRTDGKGMRSIYAAAQAGDTVQFRKAEEGRKRGAPLGLPDRGPWDGRTAPKYLKLKGSDASKNGGADGT